jgi:hypothetical protein
MPLLKLTTRIIVIGFVLMMGCDEVLAKRVKSEQKWRSCWVTSGVNRVRVKC